jgi:2-enoate reductase
MMAGKFSRLFEPVKIGEVEIKNRIAMAPMGIGGLVNSDGSPGPRALDYYLERARGGVGLIITSVFKVENEVETLLGSMMRVSRGALAPFTELSEAVHALGAKIFVQLTAGLGRVANPRRLQGPPVSASPIPSYWSPQITCREIKTEEVERLVKKFGDAAEILANAGVDGVELHGHEGYLFDQFTTAAWNHRTDKYGGDLRSRLRLPVEVLREIKRRAGKGFAVQYRFGLKHYMKALNSGALPGETFVEAGRDIPEGLEMARILEEAGFDSLHVDAGCYDAWYWAHPPVYQDNGCMIDMAGEAKKAVKIPVVGVGKMGIPEFAEKAIAEGKADLVALGKSLLADPAWVKKTQSGVPERIRPCIGCHDACMGRVTKGKPLSCAVNPATGRERAYRLPRAESPRNVWVVGGGAAGMEAARVSALRGHRVTLYEKSEALGGHMVEASVPSFKKDVARLLTWYRRELDLLPLEIRLRTEVKPELIVQGAPDAVIVATGSKTCLPDVPGIEEDKVATAPDILLGGKKAGGRVIVLGGGLIGCETALWLAQQGKKATVVEMLEDVMIGGIPVQHMNRLMMLNLLKYHGVEVVTRSSLAEVNKGGAVLIDSSFQRRNFEADSIVLAVGLSPDQELYRAVLPRRGEVFLVGDAREAQNIMNAIWDAYEVARMI